MCYFQEPLTHFRLVLNVSVVEESTRIIIVKSTLAILSHAKFDGQSHHLNEWKMFVLPNMLFLLFYLNEILSETKTPFVFFKQNELDRD